MTPWTYYTNTGARLVRQRGDDTSTAEVYRLGAKPGLPCHWAPYPDALTRLLSRTERFDYFGPAPDREVQELMDAMREENVTRWDRIREMDREVEKLRLERERQQQQSA